jgi:nucleoside-diphosphate-sugar epimerase
LKDTILVTGGKGFLGSHLVERLIELGFNVRIFARANDDKNRKGNSESDVIEGDIRNIQDVYKAVKGVDRVIHLVSNFRKGGSDKKEAYDINVTGTENVLKAASKFNVKQLIHCSTIGVHGNVREIPANEETPFNPGDLYQETKLIAEKKVRKFYSQTGLPTTVIRPISLFGPGDLRMLKLFRMIKKGRFVIVGNGKPFFQPAYIDDVVQGFVKCLDSPKALGETFIIGGDEYLPLNDLFHLISKELGVNPPTIRIPMLPTIWLAVLCEFICVPFNIEPPLHRRRVSFFQNNRAFSIEKAKSILEYQPQITLKEGIRRTLEWYAEQGLL